MRVIIAKTDGTRGAGEMLGILHGEHGPMVVVREDGCGMMLASYHPSRVTPMREADA